MIKKATILVYWKEQGHPIIHFSLDNQEWVSQQMEKNRSKAFLFEIQLCFCQNVRFVVCNQTKNNWINPKKQLSKKETYINDGYNNNFFIKENGKYVIINSVMSKIDQKIQQQCYQIKQDKQLIVINLDGVLLGDDLSLIFFNVFWMSHCYFESKILVYSTGRSISQFIKINDLIVPDYLICQGGSQISKISQNNNILQCIFQTKLTQIQQQYLKQLYSLGFHNIHKQRINSKLINKIDLRNNLKQITQLLSKLQEFGINYQMSQQSDIVYFDFTQKGNNKLQAIKIIQKRQSVNNVIVFGSNISDFLSMKYYPICVIPSNGNNKLKNMIRFKSLEMKSQFADSIIEYFEDYKMKQNQKEDN